MRVTSRELASNFDVSFVSMETDLENIVRKLFVESRPYSDYLKKLLIVNEKNCLDDSQRQYQTIIDRYSLADMKKNGYIRFIPKLSLKEHEELKSYIHIGFEDVTPSENPQYNNTSVAVMCISNLDCWELDNYAIRPWKIAGYVHGLLNNSRMSGIGLLQFVGASQFSFNEDLGGVKLNYIATHSRDDIQKISDEINGI